MLLISKLSSLVLKIWIEEVIMTDGNLFQVLITRLLKKCCLILDPEYFGACNFFLCLCVFYFEYDKFASKNSLKFISKMFWEILNIAIKSNFILLVSRLSKFNISNLCW